MRFLRRVVLLAIAVSIPACGDDDGHAPDDGGVTADAPADAGPVARDWPLIEVPASTVVELGVRRDVLRVPGVTAPPNPTTGDATPPELDATQVLRYRADVDPPAAARAIVIGMPGFLGGGGSFDALARALVLRGTAASAPIEVWAIDRRSNLLEHTRGLDTAEAMNDPEIAQAYYFGRDTIGGEEFPGFHMQGSVPYMSEWGLAVHVEDLRRVIALVPEAERRGRVFLVGHSLGGTLVEAYAAWRFEDGVRAFDEIAGLAMIDGVLGTAPITEAEYHDGAGTGFTASPGVEAIRTTTRFVELPVLGIAVHARSEIVAMRALLAPEEVVVDRGRDQLLQILLGLGAGRVPPLTNRAALGFAFDDESTAVSFAGVSAGDPTGGPVETYENGLAMATLQRPSDPTATYDWIDALEATPTEHTPIDNLARSYVHGRSNFPEWYFPARLPLDLLAVAGARVPEDGWQAAFGLRAFDGALIDAPVLAIAAGFVAPASFERVRSRIAPVIGDGRTHAGLDRTDERAFRVLDASHLTHIDPLTGADVPANPVPAALEAFVLEHAAPGGVVVP